MITPKWILDSVRELDLVTMHHDSNDVAALLATQLLQRIPQDAMRSLAEVACARAALDGSDIQQCAADLVKSIVEVLAAGDTEVMSLTALLGEAWTTLSQLGVPLGDEGSVFTLVDRIRWLGREIEAERAMARAAAARLRDANVQPDNLQTRVGDLIEIAQATKALQAEGWDFRSKTMDRLLDALAKVQP